MQIIFLVGAVISWKAVGPELYIGETEVAAVGKQQSKFSGLYEREFSRYIIAQFSLSLTLLRPIHDVWGKVGFRWYYWRFWNRGNINS